MMARSAIFAVFLGVLAGAGCADTPTPKKDSAGARSEADPKFAPLDEAKAKKTDSGLKYEDLAEGTGEPAKKYDIVLVHYTGWLTDGKKFDSSHDRKQPFRLNLGVGSVIKGWDEGVTGMKEGGKRKLHIPSDLAYGPTGRGETIPPSSDLIFEIEVVKVRPGPKVEDLKIGDGKTARFGDPIRVHYVGKLTNGKQFDSSIGKEPFTLQLGRSQVIEGWHAGIPGMKEGGKRRLTIPSELAYGPEGSGDVIPPNATLIFDIELLKVLQ